MRVIIQNDYDTMSAWAAACVVSRIRAMSPSSDRPFVLGLPTGSTPLGMYRELVRLHREGMVSFAGVVTFNMDEYAGLPAGHPASYHTYMRHNFFDHIDIRPEDINIPDGAAEDPDAECGRYEEAIRSAGGIDLFVGGVGHDGHIAFNEPGSSLASRTRVKTLNHGTRAANARFFGGDIGMVPRTAITVGVATIMDAREVLLLASGEGKARAIRMGIEDAVNHMWPLSVLQTHPRAVIVCDDDATVELRVGTVRYFKGIEEGNLDPSSMLEGLSPLRG